MITISNKKISQRQPPSELQFYDITADIDREEFPNDHSEEAECSVNPASHSAIFTINVKSVATNFVVKLLQIKNNFLMNIVKNLIAQRNQFNNQEFSPVMLKVQEPNMNFIVTLLPIRNNFLMNIAQ